MLPELLGRVVWGTGKMAVKYVVVPIAVTAALAYVLRNVADRLDERDGHLARPMIEPGV